MGNLIQADDIHDIGLSHHNYHERNSELRVLRMMLGNGWWAWVWFTCTQTTDILIMSKKLMIFIRHVNIAWWMYQTYRQAKCSGVYPPSIVALTLVLHSSMRYLDTSTCPLLKLDEKEISRWLIMAHTPHSTTHARIKQSNEYFPRGEYHSIWSLAKQSCLTIDCSMKPAGLGRECLVVWN